MDTNSVVLLQAGTQVLAPIYPEHGTRLKFGEIQNQSKQYKLMSGACLSIHH